MRYICTSTAFVLVLSIVGLAQSTPAPFACTGDAYMVQNVNAQLSRIDQSVSPFTFVPIGSLKLFEYNNLGFRTTDGLLYAAKLSGGGTVELIQIDSTGTVFPLGLPAGLPTNVRFDAGDISTDGSTMFLSNYQAAGGRLYKVDLSSSPFAVTSVPISNMGLSLTGRTTRLTGSCTEGI